jgi:hypothetical protein
VQLQTSTGTGDAGEVSATFTLSGNLRFVELPYFDLFSYGTAATAPEGEAPQDGWLRYGGLVVEMRFPLADPAQQSFTAAEGRIGFDLGNSVPRARSLAANFPVRLASLVAVLPPGTGERAQTPEDLGYTAVSAPIDASLLAAPWYGLTFSLELGTLGALAGSVGLAVTVLAAWSPGVGADQRPVYLGLQLPGARALGIDWPLQGVMRLGFRTFQFEAAEQPDGSRAYMLRLRRLALSILGWSFPQGNADVVLFGDPHGGGRQVVGWYAAYAKQPAKKTETPAAAPGEGTPALPPPARPAAVERRLRSGRRTPPPA